LKKKIHMTTANTKLLELQEFLGEWVVGWDLLAGVTCPAADLCWTWVDDLTRKLMHGPNTEHDCYAATGELRPAVYNAHKRNTEFVKNNDLKAIVDTLTPALNLYGIARPHSYGDFFKKYYFEAWLEIAKNYPEKKFFTYTKMLPFIYNVKLPDNLTIQYSYGGIYDNNITYNQSTINDLPTCFVVTADKWDISSDKTHAQAKDPKLNGIIIPLQVKKTDDFFFIQKRETFGIEIHGMQTKETKKRRADKVATWTQ